MSEALNIELLEWFDLHQRDLPWRRTKDPYAIWVSEVMLQQTQVATVIPYWERFMAQFPTVSALAAAPLEDVLAQWRGLGYYSRARNLHRAAQRVSADGSFPLTSEGLRELPGFGRYTAAAVASIAYGEAASLVDGNVARVLSRLFEVEGAPGNRDREKELWQLADKILSKKRPGDWNQALMELGALVCRVEQPTCLLCPLRGRCAALLKGRVSELPHRRVRPARKRLVLAVAVWKKRGQLLLARRVERGLFGGLWELPSAEVTGRTAPAAALKAVFGPGAQVGSALGCVERTLTHRDLKLELFAVTKGEVPQASQLYGEFKWVKPKDAAVLGMSTAMQFALKLAVRAR